MSAENKTAQVLRDFALGGSVGAITKTVMAPIERVKLLVQTQKSNPDVLAGRVERYSGIFDCFRRVRQEQGLKAFWRGNLVNVIRYAPQQGSALAVNDLLNKTFPAYDARTHFWKSFGVKLMSGGLAGAIANTIVFPFDFARTRLASDLKAGRGQFNGFADCIATTVRNQGLRGLYTGWGVTVCGAFVTRAGQLGTFKQIQDLNPWAKDTGLVGVVSSLVAVNVARMTNVPFNYPFDTVRRRMMLQSETPKAERLYKGAIDCFRKVYQSEGLHGFYQGMSAELVRGALGGALTIVAYDRIKLIYGI